MHALAGIRATKTRDRCKSARRIQVTSAIEIACGTGAVLKRLQELRFAKHFACVDVLHSAVTFARNVCGNSMSNACVASATALPFGIQRSMWRS
jgi:hypothetical protein